MESKVINAFTEIAGLYAQTDAERFPAAQLGEGLVRASTLFYADFKVAVPFGMNAVKDTFNRSNYKNRNYKAVTELAVVMNHLCWEYYHRAEEAAQKGIKALADKFSKLSEYFTERYNEVCEWVGANFTQEQAQFFWAILD